MRLARGPDPAIRLIHLPPATSQCYPLKDSTCRNMLEQFKNIYIAITHGVKYLVDKAYRKSIAPTKIIEVKFDGI